MSGSCNITDASKCTTTVTNVTSDVVIKGVGKVITFMKVIEKPGIQLGKAVITTSEGEYFIVGFFELLMLKLNKYGDIIWYKNYDGPGVEYGFSVVNSIDNNFLVVGEVSPVLAIWKVKEDGDILLTKFFEDNIYGGGYSVDNTDGGYFITGSTNNTEDRDIYLLKLDNNGEPQWSKTFGGTKIEKGYSVSPTSDGGCFVVGSTSSFGSGGEDVYVVRVDNKGKVVYGILPLEEIMMILDIQ